MKGHTNSISVLATSGFLVTENDRNVSSSWIVATGDAGGVICIFKGDDRGVVGNGKASVRATLRSAGEIAVLVFSSYNNGEYTGKSAASLMSKNAPAENLAIGTSLGSIIVLDTGTGKPIFRQERGHNAPLSCIVFFDEHDLITCGEDEFVSVWDMTDKNAGKKPKTTLDTGSDSGAKIISIMDGLVVLGGQGK